MTLISRAGIGDDRDMMKKKIVLHQLDQRMKRNEFGIEVLKEMIETLKTMIRAIEKK
jgi:hypothetical protein